MTGDIMTGHNSRTSTSGESYFRGFFDRKTFRNRTSFETIVTKIRITKEEEFPQDFNFRTILFKECHCSKMSQAPEPASRRCLGEFNSLCKSLSRKKREMKSEPNHRFYCNVILCVFVPKN